MFASFTWKPIALVTGAVSALSLIATAYYYNKSSNAENLLSVIYVAVANAVDDPSDHIKVIITKKNVVEQINNLGDSHRTIKLSLVNTNKKLEDMALEAIKLKKDKADLQLIVDKAKAQRAHAQKRIASEILTPSESKDCEGLISDAERVIDMIYEKSDLLEGVQ